MHKILIPAGDYTLKQIRGICEHYSCYVKWADSTRTYFEIISKDPTNFFWLGANWNNWHINQLNRQIEKLKQQKEAA